MYAFTKIVFFSDDIEYKVFVKLFPFGSIRTGAYKHLRHHCGREVNLKNILNSAPRKLLECCAICCMLVVVLVFNSTFVSWVHPKQQNKHLYRLVELQFPCTCFFFFFFCAFVVDFMSSPQLRTPILRIGDQVLTFDVFWPKHLQEVRSTVYIHVQSI